MVCSENSTVVPCLMTLVSESPSPAIDLPWSLVNSVAALSAIDNICMQYTIWLFLDSSTCNIVHPFILTEHSYRRHIRNHGSSRYCICINRQTEKPNCLVKLVGAGIALVPNCCTGQVAVLLPQEYQPNTLLCILT